MEYWWKENRGFVIPVALAVIVFGMWYVLGVGAIRAGGEKIRIARENKETEYQRRIQRGEPSEDTVRRARADLERTNKLVEELKADLSLRMPDSYKSSKSAPEFFSAMKEDVRKDVVKKAQQHGVLLPDNSLGFPQNLQGLADDVAIEYLERLAIVERLATTAAAAGVSKIDTVNAIVGTAGPGEGTDDLKKALFLKKVAVRMKVTGPSQSVFQWLHAVQKKGDGLVVDDFKAEKLSPHEDIFSAELEVSGLKIDPSKAVAEAKE